MQDFKIIGVVERLGLSLSSILQFNEGHFLSVGGVVCSSQIRLAQAVGSVIHKFEGPRVAATFHCSCILPADTTTQPFSVA